MTMTEGTNGLSGLHVGEGWHVLHDLTVPGTGAGVDHVVVTPAGAFVIDLSHRDGTDPSGVLWAGRASRRRALTHLRWEVNVVSEALAAAPVAGPVAVGGIVAVAGQFPATGPQVRARGVDVVPLAGIVRFLTAKPRHLDPTEVDAVAACIERRLGARYQAVVSADGAVQVALAS